MRSTTTGARHEHGRATAVLVAPIVIQAAVELGVSPHSLLIIVAVAASTAEIFFFDENWILAISANHYYLLTTFDSRTDRKKRQERVRETANNQGDRYRVACEKAGGVTVSDSGDRL